MCSQIFVGLTVVMLITKGDGQGASCQCDSGETCDPSNYYCKNGCRPEYYGPGCQIRNIALRKATYMGYKNQQPQLNLSDKVVDGIYNRIDQQYPWNKCTDMDRNLNGYWQVILGTNQSYTVVGVTVINAPFMVAAPRRYYKILVGQETEPYQPSDSWKVCDSGYTLFPYSIRFACTENYVPARSLVFAKEIVDDGIILCEVIVDGYEYQVCDPGYAGPLCLLRSCANESCLLQGGTCGPFGGCRYSRRCPDDGKLPPDCWITFSNFATNMWRIWSTDSRIIIDGIPRIPVNFQANMLSIEVLSNGTKVNYTGKYQYRYPPDGSVTVTIDAEWGMSYKVRVTPTLCFREKVCPFGVGLCYDGTECYEGGSSEWLSINLTLPVIAQVTLIPPSNETDCREGFAGPQCRLRSCDYDYCEVYGGVCGPHGGCRFASKCPQENELPQDCWKTFSNFAQYEWTISRISSMAVINGNPKSSFDVVADQLLVDVTANRTQINATEKYRYSISMDGSLTLTMDIEPGITYNVRLTPRLCFKEKQCLYDQSSCYNSSDCLEGIRSGWLLISPDIAGPGVSEGPFTTLPADTENTASMVTLSVRWLLVVIFAAMARRQDELCHTMPSDYIKNYC